VLFHKTDLDFCSVGQECPTLQDGVVSEVYTPRCRAADRDICPTETQVLLCERALVGLERAFVRAGSPSLLTTLWPVDDSATAVLMERFYTHLRAGIPKAEALRLAQVETRAGHPEPYYWAGFVLVGDAGLPAEVTSAPQSMLDEATPTPQPIPTEG